MPRSTRSLATTTEQTPTLVGIGGRLASGKDTLADELVSQHGFVKLNFSSPLVRFASVVNPLVEAEVRFNDWVEMLGLTAAKERPEIRRILQTVGDALRAEFGSQVLVDLLDADIKRHLERGESVVITGVRFPAEVELIKKHDGLSVWVSRLGSEHSENGSHITENAVDVFDFDMPISNDKESADEFARFGSALVMDELRRKASGEEIVYRRSGGGYVERRPRNTEAVA